MAERAAVTGLGKLGAGIAMAMLAVGLASPGPAAGQATPQIAPRLTGELIGAQLDAAQHDLAARATESSGSSLAATSRKLGDLGRDLRKALGKDMAKPIDTLGNDEKAQAYRAEAVVQRAQAFLEASKGCLGQDVIAMADALARTVALKATASGGSKLPPVINGVETLDRRPLFVLHGDGTGAAFALTGENLFDAQCASPVVSATDAQGKSQAVQPEVTGVLPNRIELKLPAGPLPSGSYVLNVVAQRKVFLLGCTAQPPASAVLEVAPAPKVSVSYSVTQTCPAPGGGQGRALPAITGDMPVGTGKGTVAKYVAVNGCADPLSYAISATVTFGDGHSSTVGPISQIASAGITAGLPGGLSLSWDPSVHQLVVRPAASSCKGVY
ncbi:hypothetical protein [Rhodanobacter lindaniclasticus]|uniref:Uncharacterized protein n=1 Tax=Rhodanobacter lindaniclasticus TaxID=75310 RepID=A0A4S3K983_9GAMM|nr:hypothetical protein [Rhodanobacter lindaniclasticus]THD04852.1 hypothetical protein B1991_17210 [Rhodanobacter lindaniclasticus]